MEKKDWLRCVAALGLFALVPGFLWSQQSGSDQDAFIIKTGATTGTIHLDLDTYSAPDKCHMYCPPRGKKGSKLIYKTPGTNGISTYSLYPKVTQGYRNVTNIVKTWNGGTEIEVVMNMNFSNAGSSWDYNATLYPKGGRPIIVIRDPTKINWTPPKVNTTGTIFQSKGSGRSSAGSPKGRPAGGGKVPPRRRGYVTRIVTPTTSSTGNTLVLTPKSATTKGSSKSGGSSKISKVLFSGKGSITTHIRKLPTRSVRRIALRGGRPY